MPIYPGVPEIRPDDGSSVTPLGSAPDSTVQTHDNPQPVAKIVSENGVSVMVGARDVTDMSGLSTTVMAMVAVARTLFASLSSILVE